MKFFKKSGIIIQDFLTKAWTEEGIQGHRGGMRIWKNED